MVVILKACSITTDNAFGPQVDPCLRSFDFTLLFEETVLTILPLGLVLLAAACRLIVLSKRRRKARLGVLSTLKLLFQTVFSILQLILLVIWNQPTIFRTRASIPCAALTFVASIVFVFLSQYDHLHSECPSTLLELYFVYSFLVDIARVRTLWMIPADHMIAIVYTVAMASKIPILVVETLSKKSLLEPNIIEYTSPQSISSIISLGVFWWMNPIFKKGFRSTIVLDDFFPLDRELDANFLVDRIHVDSITHQDGKTHNLALALFLDIKWPFLSVILPRLCGVGFRLAQPFLINSTLNYFATSTSEASLNTGYGLIGAYFLVYTGLAISTAVSQNFICRLLAMVRGILVSAVYRRTLELSATSVSGAAPLTLMSTDVEMVCNGLKGVHETWANLLQAAIALFLLSRQLGPGSAAPVSLVALSLILATYIGQRTGAARKRWVEAIQKRVGVTTEILGAIKSIRLSGLVDFISTLVQNLRVHELDVSKAFRYLITTNVTVAYTTDTLSPVLGFAIYLADAKRKGEALDTTRAFTALSLFTLVSAPLNSLVQFLPFFFTAKSGLERIQAFLLNPSRKDYRTYSLPPKPLDIDLVGMLKKESGNTSEKEERISTEVAMDATELAIQQGTFRWKAEDRPVLKDINLTIQSSQLTMIIGPVSSGKTSLLQALLGEMPIADGSIFVSSTNIAFCGQSPWLKNTSAQQNILGEDLFDKDWYREVIHVCVLDQTLKALPNGDQTIVGSKGFTLSGGEKLRIALARAVYAKTRIILLDDVLSGLDASTETLLFRRLLGRNGLFRKMGSTVVLATHSVKNLSAADHIVVLGSDGTIVEQSSFQKVASERPELLAYGLNEATLDDGPADKISSTLASKEVSAKTAEADGKTGANRSTGDASTYKYYFSSFGWGLTIMLIGVVVVHMFSRAFSDLWLSWWTDSSSNDQNQKLGIHLGIYAFLAVMSLLSVSLTLLIMLVPMTKRSAEHFHWVVLKAVMHTPLSFFTKTDMGVTTNRFSQDMTLVDMELPSAAMNTLFTFANCLAQFILLSITTRYLAITLPFCIVVLYLIQHCYLRTSRQLRLLDLETKSPLYSHFIETLSGLSTIRAFGWQTQSESRNIGLLNSSTRPYLTLLCAQAWLKLVLDLTVAGIAVLTIGTAVALRGVISAGFVGVALVNVMMFSTTISLFISSWTGLEMSLGAILRIKTFEEETPSEDRDGEDFKPPHDWPSQGAVELRHVSASYGDEYDLALSDLSLSIKPGEKIGICGSTGSGKSSFILAMFRMIELSAGSIIVDDIDISTLPRNLVRSSFVAVPQEPFLFDGSIRLNVDPTRSKSDEAIREVLQMVQLGDVVNDRGSLDKSIDEVQLSHGQKQLLCLARALLRPGKIVLLDEATSSIDNDTENIINKVVISQFQNRTIIAVAHRLNTIVDFDRIAVFDKGRLVEFDTPTSLLLREGAFSKLYKEYQGGPRVEEEIAVTE